jgi:hypothetical protein
MKTPASSQAPDLMRIVSWIRQCWEKFLLAMVIAVKPLGGSDDISWMKRTMFAQ